MHESLTGFHASKQGHLRIRLGWRSLIHIEEQKRQQPHDASSANLEAISTIETLQTLLWTLCPVPTAQNTLHVSTLCRLDFATRREPSGGSGSQTEATLHMSCPASSHLSKLSLQGAAISMVMDAKIRAIMIQQNHRLSGS